MATKKILFNKGFTLIEMMVALALFTIVITIASGSILSLIGANAKGQGEQNTMSTITFALDSMTREIRTGISYYGTTMAIITAPVSPTSQGSWDKTVKADSPAGAQGISFIESGSSITVGSVNHRIAYYYDGSSVNTHTIMRKVDDDDPEAVISDDIYVTSASFSVTDTNDLNNDNDNHQPAVTIIISARDKNDTDANPKIFTIETTITQRELDI